MGDVAMAVPVIRHLLNQHPELTVIFVSEKKFQPLFAGIEHLVFFGADIRGKYGGVVGLFRLYRQLVKGKKIEAIADLHNVIRTKVLRLFFNLSGYKIAQIDKGRADKKALTRRYNKRFVQLPTTFQRYADVFSKLGYPIRLPGAAQTEQAGIKEPITLNASKAVLELLYNKQMINIGLAPFAKHKEKMYPTEEMEKVVEALTKKGHRLFLFGGGIEEIKKLEQWEKLYPGAVNVAGKLLFEEELMLISRLHLMISMDSANMHLASLYGVPVVSIWGATHPFAGFYGYRQELSNIIQADLSCRPCSVFGNKECYRGDWACMKLISPQQIIKKVEEILQIAAR